jgi:UDP-GlcNAc:undecaprenyl-phosphate GlcNAc-1-phosphate transferase
MWSPVFTILWLIALPNVINLIDGMDGLATGFGLFLCLTLAFVGHFSGMADVVMISTVMAGALAGFLLFNFPPARIFLGDGGAYLIGFFIATVSLNCSQKGYVVSAMLVMVVAMGLPILDTLFAIVRRAVRGVPVFRADAEHIHHRLISLGYSKGQALAILYTACAALSLVGIYLLTQKGQGTVVVMAALAIGVLAVARVLGYVKSFRGLRLQFGKAMARRRDLAVARAYGQVIELEAERMETAAEFAELLSRSLKRLGFTLNPEHGRQAGGVPLLDGNLWMVGRTELDVDEERWRARLEALVPGVSRAVGRWKNIPGIVVARSAEAAEVALAGETYEEITP